MGFLMHVSTIQYWKYFHNGHFFTDINQSDLEHACLTLLAYAALCASAAPANRARNRSAV
jgi:hypothetical protein